MKITNSNTIRSSQRELIDSINAELDWGAIEQLLLEKHKFTLQDEVDYKNGDLVVFKEKIAYQFDFEIKVSLSVTFGRDGECLELSTSGGDETEKTEKKTVPAGDRALDPDPDRDGESGARKDISSMASSIAGMISDINNGGR
ncbi:MAG: hypothetical protein R6V54_00840 [Desulfobacteraceae bacterium]